MSSESRPNDNVWLAPFSQTSVAYAHNIDTNIEAVRAIPLTLCTRAHSFDRDAEHTERRCLVGMASKTGAFERNFWLECQEGYLPYIAELRWKYLAFCIELSLGCWPGWTYHTVMHTIIPDPMDPLSQSSHAVWTFVVGNRIASPVAGAPLGKLGPNDWIYTSDRIAVSLASVYVPAWFSHDSDMYKACSLLHKYIPSTQDEPLRAIKDKRIDRMLLPLSQSHPHHSSQIKELYNLFSSIIHPAKPVAVPLYTVKPREGPFTLAMIPGMRSRLVAVAPLIDSIKYLDEKELSFRLWQGTIDRKMFEAQYCVLDKEEQESSSPFEPFDTSRSVKLDVYSVDSAPACIRSSALPCTDVQTSYILNPHTEQWGSSKVEACEWTRIDLDARIKARLELVQLTGASTDESGVQGWTSGSFVLIVAADPMDLTRRDLDRVALIELNIASRPASSSIDDMVEWLLRTVQSAKINVDASIMACLVSTLDGLACVASCGEHCAWIKQKGREPVIMHPSHSVSSKYGQQDALQQRMWRPRSFERAFENFQDEIYALKPQSVDEIIVSFARLARLNPKMIPKQAWYLTSNERVTRFARADGIGQCSVSYARLPRGAMICIGGRMLQSALETLPSEWDAESTASEMASLCWRHEYKHDMLDRLVRDDAERICIVMIEMEDGK